MCQSSFRMSFINQPTIHHSKSEHIRISDLTYQCIQYSTMGNFFFPCYFFSPSRLMTCCLGNIQWKWLQLTLFLAATHFLECFMTITSSLDVFLPLISLSFFNPHPSNRVSFSHLTSLRSSPIRARPFARQWSFAGGRSCFVSKFQIPRVSILMRWRDFFELAAGFDLAPFRKNVTEVVRSSPRPRCLGTMGNFGILAQGYCSP